MRMACSACLVVPRAKQHCPLRPCSSGCRVLHNLHSTLVPAGMGLRATAPTAAEKGRGCDFFVFVPPTPATCTKSCNAQQGTEEGVCAHFTSSLCSCFSASPLGMHSEILTGLMRKLGHGGEGDVVRDSMRKRYRICMYLHRVGNNL